MLVILYAVLILGALGGLFGLVLAVASNGLHTNGYTLVRMLMDTYPEIKDTIV